MSIYDQQQLLASVHPFDVLDDAVIAKLSAQMDIAYYPKETVLISSSIGSEHLYIIIKGSVNEFIDDELHNVYDEGDSFDANALIYSTVKSKFVVQEDLICYLLPKETFLNLIQDHEQFQNFFMKDFIEKHQSLKEHQHQNDLTSFMMTRVCNIFLHPACIVDETESISGALHKMEAMEATAIIVQNKQEFGIITDADLRKNVLIAQTPLTAPAREIASFPLVCIDTNEFLFNALLMFIKYGIKRLAVIEEGNIIGVLEQLDLLSHFANHSHLIAVQVDKAKNIEELAKIQKNQLYLVESLHSKGVKVRYISKLVSELNAKIYAKVYEFSVPKELRDRAALIVMGSEGRQEQILHTDQDNALIIEDTIDSNIFKPYMQSFSDAMVSLGFPPCPGKIMVNNPHWCQNSSVYKQRIDRWMDTLSDEKLQELSIFSDAQFIAGNAQLLHPLLEYLHRRFVGRDDALAHIAKTALSFETPLSLFSGFILEQQSHKNEIDLKKGGMFAIVHGIRTLALENNIVQTNTTLRIKALNNKGVFDKKFATELIEAFDTLLAIRLKSMLQHPNSFEDANFIDPAKLQKIERDLLKDSFKVVNTFKKFLTYHFHLNVVM